MFLTACNDFGGMRTATADVKSNEGKKIQCPITCIKNISRTMQLTTNQIRYFL